MRYSTLFTLLVISTLASAEAQVKKGGLFGFGSNDDQISAALFPTTAVSLNTSTGAPVSPEPAAQPERSESDTIFRGGDPAEVDAVSYVIDANGQKVEKEIDSKKKGLFGFGKKAEKPVAESLTPIPEPTYPEPQLSNVIPVPAPEAAGATAPAMETITERVADTVADTSEAISEAVNTPPPAGEKKKSGGFFSIFGGKKAEDVPETPAFAMPDGVVAVEESTAPAAPATPAAPAAPATTSTPAAPTTPAAPAPAPASTPASPAPATTDAAPRFAGTEPEAKPEAKPEKEGFSLPNPIAKIRGQKEEKTRTIDLTGAETIIQNGEIVAAPENIVESNRDEESSGDRQPPRMVNGVKTYSSWDDIEARSVSAADKILNQIR